MSYFNSGNRVQGNTPIVTNLIIINVLVYLAQLFFKQIDVTELGSLHYYKSEKFYPVQIVSAMFLHSPQTIMHIVFNMFGLYIFGSILERFWGSKRFLFFYLICGVGASILEQFTIPYTVERIVRSLDIHEQGFSIAQITEAYLQEYSALGASGALMGVMAAFAYLFPNTELMILFIPFPVKAKYLIPFFVLVDLFGGIYGIPGLNIAHFAHLGGALIGFLLVLYWNKKNRRTFY
ncbi:rhomboid family intramembrane serine protease [Lacibacter sp. MH-610]|uniref:rhomboid family intramembrane serine protease n=1 Tax=Lacibacter sp. MH-610 TaxID=3020883 RepID=UPI003891841D